MVLATALKMEARDSGNSSVLRVVCEKILTHLPMVLTIIGFAYKRPRQMSELEEALDDSWQRVDVRKWLQKDPQDGGVGHDERGDSPNTQQAVIAQDGFYELMTHLMECICTDTSYLRLTLGCNQNNHRSEVCGFALEAYANSIETNNGQRVFNARYFSLSACHDAQRMSRQVWNATQWSEEPWELMPTVDFYDRKSLYGYEGASRDKIAYKAWKDVWTFVASDSATFLQPLIDEMEGAQDADEDGTTWGEDKKGGRKSLTPKAPKEPPAAIEDEPPEWATETFTVDAWYTELVKLGADAMALKSLFALCQMNEKGKFLAQDIVNKAQIRQLPQPCTVDAPQRDDRVYEALGGDSQGAGCAEVGRTKR